MKKLKFSFFATALFALSLFVSVAQAVTASAAKRTLNWSIAAESPRRTAFVRGDYGRTIAIYNVTNVGTEPSALTDVYIKSTPSISYLIVKVGDWQYGAMYSWIDRDTGMGKDQFNFAPQQIAPGKTLKVYVRVGFTWDASTAAVYLDGFGGTFDSGQFPNTVEPIHAVVEELRDEGTANASFRATVSPQKPGTLGFIVKGDEGRAYPYLIRAVGPGLKEFGVAGTLEDPLVNVYSKDGLLASNDDWSDLEWAFQQVGAFPLKKGSFDSAVVVYLTPGSYTVSVKGFGSGTGEVLIEQYRLPMGISEKG